MSRTQRIVFLVVGVVLVIVALGFYGLGGRATSERVETATLPDATTAAQTDSATTATTTTATTTTAAPAEPPMLRAGRTLRFRKGELIRFRFRNAAADELHIHGYDRTYELQAGVTRTIAFKATIDGIFEVELHHSGAPAGRLRVDP